MSSSILPTHPRTGLTAVGFRRDGRPVWPVMGGSEDADAAAADQGDDTDATDTGEEASEAASGEADAETDGPLDGEDALGDPGKKALEAMKEREKAARAKTRAAEKRALDLEAELAKAKGEDEATIRQREADQAALAKANARIVKAEVRAAAKGVLADAEDAFRYLDLDEIEVGDDGDVDADDIADRIKDLVTRKPYLAAQRKPGEGSFDSGRGKPAAKSQLSREDLAKLPHAERLQAVKDGRVKLT